MPPPDLPIDRERLVEGSYRERNAEQFRRWLAGDPVHNGAKGDPRGECCPDFSCCKPQYLAPLEEREAFAAAQEAGDDRQRGKMLGMFLGRLLAGEAPGKKVYMTDGEHHA